MGDVERTLGRIEGKLDGICDDIRETKASLRGQGQRIAGLEKSRSKFIGIVGAVGFAFSFAAVWLREKIFG